MAVSGLPYTYPTLREDADGVLDQTGFVHPAFLLEDAVDAIADSSIDTLRRVDPELDDCFGGLSHDGRWGWMYIGSVLEVTDMTTKTRISTLSLGGPDTPDSVIRCVCEYNPEDYPALLALVLDDGSGTGSVHLYDPEHSVTVSTITLPGDVAVVHHLDSSATPASLDIQIGANFPGVDTRNHYDPHNFLPGFARAAEAHFLERYGATKVVVAVDRDRGTAFFVTVSMAFSGGLAIADTVAQAVAQDFSLHQVALSVAAKCGIDSREFGFSDGSWATRVLPYSLGLGTQDGRVILVEPQLDVAFDYVRKNGRPLHQVIGGSADEDFECRAQILSVDVSNTWIHEERGSIFRQRDLDAMDERQAQKLDGKLRDTPAFEPSKVTTIAALSGSLGKGVGHVAYIAAGYASGSVVVWQLGDPMEVVGYYVGLPIELDELGYQPLGVAGIVYRRPTCDTFPVLCVAYNTLTRNQQSTGVICGYMSDIGISSGGSDRQPPALFSSIKLLHALGAASEGDPEMSSNVLSMRVVDERADPTRWSTGVWDDTDRFVPIEVVWSSTAADTPGHAPGHYVGLLDIDTLDAFERLPESSAYLPLRDATDVNPYCEYFEVYSVRPDEHTINILDVRIDPKSIGSFRALSAAQLGLADGTAEGGRIESKIRNVSFEVDVFGISATHRLRFECTQQQALQALAGTAAVDLAQADALFDMCRAARLLVDPEGTDETDQKRERLMDLAVVYSKPAIITRYITAAADAQDTDTLHRVRQWLGGWSSDLERGDAVPGSAQDNYKIPVSPEENDEHQFLRMCKLSSLRTIHGCIMQCAEQFEGTSAQGKRDLHELGLRIDAEWNRSRVLDWSFASGMLPDHQAAISEVIAELPALYTQLREEAAGGRLLVDALCEDSGIPSRRGEFPCPPRSIRNMYRLLVKGQAAAQEQHYGLFLYFLMDVDSSLGTDFGKQFAESFGITTGLVDTVTLFWNVDRGHIQADRDAALLNFVLSDSVLIRQQDAAVLHAICHRRHPDKALELLQLKQTAFAGVEDIQLFIDILVKKSRVVEAFDHVRATAEANVRQELLAFFFNAVWEAREIASILQLPLDAEEEAMLVDDLTARAGGAVNGGDLDGGVRAHEAIVLYRVHRAQYVQAIMTHRPFMDVDWRSGLVRFHGHNLDPSHLRPAQINRLDDLRALLRGYETLLPQVQRRLAAAADPSGSWSGRAAHPPPPATARSRGPVPMRLEPRAHAIGTAMPHFSDTSMHDARDGNGDGGAAGAEPSAQFLGPPVTPSRRRQASTATMVFPTPRAASDLDMSAVPMDVVRDDVVDGRLQFTARASPESPLTPDVVLPPPPVASTAVPSSILKSGTKGKSGKKKKKGIQWGADTSQEAEEVPTPEPGAPQRLSFADDSTNDSDTSAPVDLDSSGEVTISASFMQTVMPIAEEDEPDTRDPSQPPESDDGAMNTDVPSAAAADRVEPTAAATSTGDADSTAMEEDPAPEVVPKGRHENQELKTPPRVGRRKIVKTKLPSQLSHVETAGAPRNAAASASVDTVDPGNSGDSAEVAANAASSAPAASEATAENEEDEPMVEAAVTPVAAPPSTGKSRLPSSKLGSGSRRQQQPTRVVRMAMEPSTSTPARGAAVVSLGDSVTVGTASPAIGSVSRRQQRPTKVVTLVPEVQPSPVRPSWNPNELEPEASPSVANSFTLFEAASTSVATPGSASRSRLPPPSSLGSTTRRQQRPTTVVTITPASPAPASPPQRVVLTPKSNSPAGASTRPTTRSAGRSSLSRSESAAQARRPVDTPAIAEAAPSPMPLDNTDVDEAPPPRRTRRVKPARAAVDETSTQVVNQITPGRTTRSTAAASAAVRKQPLRAARKKPPPKHRANTRSSAK